MQINNRSPWLRYGLAIGLFIVTIAVSAALIYLGYKLNLAIVIGAVIVAATWFGGRGPGVLLAMLIVATSIVGNPVPPGATPASLLFGYYSVAALVLVLVFLVDSRRNAKNRLREQREMLQVTLSSIGDAVIATDLDGRITFTNPTAERLTGYSKDEAMGMAVRDVFRTAVESDRSSLVDPHAVGRAGNLKGLARDTTLISKSGNEIPIEDSEAPITDPRGNTVGAVIVFHDITARRQAEQEREELLKRERDARSEAETANRLKDEFLAMVSHELRTPLNAILGWASLLESEKPENESIRNALSVIVRNAKAQDSIISDLLDVSRIVSGQLKVDLRPVELVPAIRAAIDALYPAAQAKSISIKTSLFDSPCKINGDAVRLRQIFSNLLSNAIKFTPRGGQVDIKLIQNDAKVEIRIADQGVGIAKPFLKNIFERFQQADTSMKRTHGGLGLGLAIVRHLVELHCGKITAESKGEGKGATFTVEFDLVIAPVTSATRRSTINGAPDLDGLRILVVDDDPDTLEVLCFALERYGAQTHGASSCSAAVEIFAEWKPNVLVSDLAMPGEDGFDLIRKVRSLSGSSGAIIPAAALSASVREEDCLDALAAGFQIHIAKPVDPLLLATELAELSKYSEVRR